MRSRPAGSSPISTTPISPARRARRSRATFRSAGSVGTATSTGRCCCWSRTREAIWRAPRSWWTAARWSRCAARAFSGKVEAGFPFENAARYWDKDHDRLHAAARDRGSPPARARFRRGARAAARTRSGDLLRAREYPPRAPGSRPGQAARGRKWFITGAGAAEHFIVVARTSDDPRHGLTAFLFHRDQPGWRIVRRIEIMGPEEHGGHCELEFDGLEVPDENVVLKVGDGLRVTQIRLGPARLTHCMRWLGLSKRCLEIAQEYVGRREGFGIKLADRESVQIKLGQVAHQIQIGRLLTMHAAWKLDQGDRARKEVSMAKVHVADTLHNAADVAIQLNGARGYSKDTILEWVYRAARAARLVDGATEVHMMVLARFMREEGRDFWSWSAGNRV